LEEGFLLVERGRSEGRDLVLYFLIAFGFTWFFWISEALAVRGRLGSSILVDFLLSSYNPAAWGPLVAAFSLTYLSAGKDGVRKLLRKGVDYQFGKIWWLPTFFLMPAIIGGSLVLSVLTEGVTPDLPWISDPFMLVVVFVYLFFSGGPLQEEFGWRGYALPRLQTRFSALVSSLILGFMWGAWHLPYFWIGEEIIYQQPVWGLMLSAILVSILFTWLYNNTGGSILVALIFHTMHNFSWVLFPPSLESELGGLYYLILLLIAPIVITIVWGPKRLVRESEKS
jgi:membrane protease YdiL (CAAX protease family)